MENSAPAHRLIAVRDWLRELFGHRVIALPHDVEWPPRYHLNDLQNRIQHKVEELKRNKLGLIRRGS